MSDLIQECDDAISFAIMKLMRSSNLAFDVSILLNLKRQYVNDDDLIIAVNDTTLIVNPEKFLQENKNDQQFMLRHEAWHVIGFDMLRAKDRDPEVWNKACDYWINHMIYHDQSYSLSLPNGCLYSEKFKNWDKEEIYEYLLVDNEKPNNDKYGSDLRDSSDEQSDSYGENDRNKLAELVAKSAIQAKAAGGKIPADIQDYLDNLYSPKLNWKQLLIKYMHSLNRHDYSFKRPNKRFLPQGILLPSSYSEGVGTIYVATDQSSSVSDDDYQRYIGAIKDIQKSLEPELIEVIGFTNKIIHRTKVDKTGDIDLLKYRTRGGTDVRCVFDYIENNKLNPDVLLVFSDMETRLPPKPKYDVIWVCINNPTWVPPNYGKVIYVNEAT